MAIYLMNYCIRFDIYKIIFFQTDFQMLLPVGHDPHMTIQYITLKVNKRNKLNLDIVKK